MPSGEQIARRLYVKSDIRVGEPTGGGQTPSTDQFVTAQSTAQTVIAAVTYSSAAASPVFRGFRSYGDAAAPTLLGTSGVDAGTLIVSLRGSGYNGSTWVDAGAVRIATAETWSTSANGTVITFATVTTGTT